MIPSLSYPVHFKLARGALVIVSFMLIFGLANGTSSEERSFGGKGFNETVSREKVLIKNLLDRYSKYGRIGRPLANTSDYIGVEFALSLIQVINLDEKDQVLTISVWYEYVWKDVLLKWDPKDYDNIRDVRVPASEIWIPDIVLYNFADTRLKEQREALVVVQYNGTTLWMPQAILKSTCPIDITYFPFDKQNCTMKFGSWTYSGNKLDLRFKGDEEFLMASYITSHEWDVLEHSAVRNRVDYDCCPDYFLDLTYTLRMKRRVAFYSVILVLPCALLSLLTLVIFWVPPESPAKLQLGMNIFVAFFVLLLLLAESTPRAASSIPLIGAYYCLNMIMITVSTILACVGANMFFRGVRRNRAPRWLRVIMIDGVAKVLRLRKDLIDVDEDSSKKWSLRVLNDGKNRFNNHDVKVAKIRLLDTPNGKEAGEKMSTVHEVLDSSRCSTYNQGNEDCRTAVVEELKTIRQMLERVRDQRSRREEQERFLREWRVITCITDRLFFIIYVICNMICILMIFFSGS